MKKEISKYHPHESQSYFIYDPEGEGFIYFESEKNRDIEAIKSVEAYLDTQDGWDENVTGVIVGKLTGKSAMINVEIPDGELDEESLDETGEYWDYDYKCNYTIKPLGFVCPSTNKLKE